MSELSKRLREHVNSRGGLSKNEAGEVVISNGAWAMMLEAADEIEKLEQRVSNLGWQVSDMRDELECMDHRRNW